MKLTKSVAVGAAAALFLVVLSAPSLQAQSQPLRVAIPFTFHVADQKLPAGTYTVQKVGAAIWISDRRGHNATILTNLISKRPADVKDQLTFTHYGEEFFLSEASWVGYNTALGVMKSKAESKLANTISPDRVIIAALLR